MRNPLKKLQKKINVRLASKAAQYSEQVKLVDASPPKTKPAQQNDTSCTSLSTDQEDPLFGNGSSKGALGNSNNSNRKKEKAEATPKKKKRGRLSFGGRKSIGSVPKRGPLYQEPSESGTGADPDLDPKVRLVMLPRPEDFKKAPREALRTPPREAHTTPPRKARVPAQAPESPDSPSSNLHIPAPPNYRTPTKRSDAASALFSISTKTDEEPPKRRIYRSNTPPPKKEPQHQERVVVDPNIERIAKAAAALDNTGNQAFERGEYDKAMAIYAKALKLKKRTLNKIEHTEGSDDEAELSLVKDKTPIKPPSSTQASKEHSTPAGADELWISVATSINNIGYLKQQSGQASAEETMKAYQNSLQIKRRVLGDDNLSVGKTLNNLGTVHYLKRDYTEALKAYQEALQIMKASLGAHHLDVGTVHSNIGDVYWAQSGDTKFASENNASPNRSYQASRSSALRHYRHSLEIRWEQLQDHQDPKVIRLLEKIAALEMGESFLALVQTNRKYRPATIGENGETVQGNDEAADEALDKDNSRPPIEQEMQTLHEEVRKDVRTMDLLERKMAIDMVKDKLRLIREMKNLSNLDIYNMDLEELSLADDLTPRKSPLNKGPLSPVQREEALSSVKTRLHQLRESRKNGTNFFPRTQASSDLKEIDGSPTHYASQKASNLLNRMNPDRSVASDQNPSNRTSGLDELRNFSLEPLPEHDANGEENKPVTTFSPRTANTLNQGIGALRGLSLNSQPDTQATWLPAPSTPQKTVASPTTPLPSASAASF